MSDRGRYSYKGLDRVLHERARLGICCCLASAHEPIPFRDLRELCELTDGNLSRHLKALEESEIVELMRGTQSGRSTTLVQFSKGGQQRFLDYLDVLETIVQDAGPARGGELQRRPQFPDGWLPA